MRFQPQMFTVLFGIPRTAGWLAQSQEMIPDAEQTIARPRQVYTGYDVRQFVPIAKRVQVATSAALIGLGLEVVGKKSQDSESREQLLAASLLGRGKNFFPNSRDAAVRLPWWPGSPDTDVSQTRN